MQNVCRFQLLKSSLSRYGRTRRFYLIKKSRPVATFCDVIDLDATPYSLTGAERRLLCSAGFEN